jgi:hypothetical protein
LERRWAEIFFALNCFEAELVNTPLLVRLDPGIDQMEDPVVAPDPGPNLLVHPYPLWSAAASLRVLSCPMELAVLCEIPRRQSLEHSGELWG